MNKKNIVKLSLILITFIILNTYLNYKNYLKTEQIIIDNNAKILEFINKNDKSLEEDFIKILNENKKVNYIYLEKYNLNKIEDLENIGKIRIKRKKYISSSILLNLIFLILIIIFLTIYFYKMKKDIDKIDSYVEKSLNGNYDRIVLKNNETSLNRLENDIYKLSLKLKNKNEILNKDKIILKDHLSDISHQLKTPLTTLNINNDILKSSNVSKEKKVEFLNESNKQIEKMNFLIKTLLKLSKLDAGIIEFKKENIKVSKILNDIKKSLMILAKEKNIDIEIKVSNNTKIYSDYNWINEAISNIVKNAIEHSNKYSKILITCNDNPIYTGIEVINEGEKIKKSEIKTLFERFKKRENSNKDSVGIGLAISKNIIENLNGSIEVISDKKTIFKIKLYK